VKLLLVYLLSKYKYRVYITKSYAINLKYSNNTPIGIAEDVILRPKLVRLTVRLVAELSHQVPGFNYSKEHNINTS
jgi:hypothetical protein